jgi:phosphoserine phosphatase
MNSQQLLVVLDVDSTLTQDEGIDLLAAQVSKDVAHEVAAITESAMRGEVDFEESLRRRVATLQGIPESLVAEASAKVRLSEGARVLVDTLHAEGHLVGALSGGFHSMIDSIAEDLGLDFHRANRLEVAGGVLTGKLAGPLIDGGAKARTLQEWAQSAGIPRERCVAVGDGGNDVEMLAWAGLGVAYMAKPVAREAADVAVDTPDLSQVLLVLGLIRG